MKLPFGRKKNQIDAMPAEIKNYYQTEQRERAGIAWMLAIGVFIATLLLAVGLFYAGRWAINKINDEPGMMEPTSQQPVSESPSVGESQTPGEETPPNVADTPDTTQTAPAEAPRTPTPAPVVLPDTNGDR